MLRVCALAKGAAVLSKRNEFVKKMQPASLLLVRNIWGFTKHDDEIKDAMEEAEQDTSSSSKGIVSPGGDHSPTISPLLILPNKRPVFPGHLTGVVIKDEATIDALVNSKSPSGNYVGLFYRKREENSDIIKSIDDIHTVGTFAQVQHAMKTDLGTQIIFLSHRRISLEDVTSYGPPTIANVKHWKKPTIRRNNATIKAYTNEIMTMARELVKHNPLLREQIQLQSWATSLDLTDPHKLTDLVIALTTAEAGELQKLLEMKDIEERLGTVLELMAKEKEIAKVQREITKQVEEKVSKQQREYFLREQLKTIKKELGMEKDDKEELTTKYWAVLGKIKEKSALPHVPSLDNIIKLIEGEIKKLESLEKNSPEFNVVRSYLDWLTIIPWGDYSKDKLELVGAKQILDEDHYGLEDIKTRILEFIAVGKLTGSITGKILCFLGPPGVGKTSIAKSIARALDRPFYRFSVGGLTDTAEIKGHRRTYIGAMPGKPIQSFKLTNVMNPVILIDEIDKLGKQYGNGGDPASALLELLDPNQNASFVDHYLDTPVDFSQVLFVCTANDESGIPGPLKDRMEVIRLSGYDLNEKVEIAQRYLVPKALRDNGLWPKEKLEGKEGAGDVSGQVPAEHVHVTSSQSLPYQFPLDALEDIIKGYCREAGVRNLEKTIDKIVRKLAYQKVTSEEKQSPENLSNTSNVVIIKKEELEKYIGKKIFVDENMYNNSSADSPLPPGIVMGLAWNPLGGSPIFIETVALPQSNNTQGNSAGGGGGIRVVTGQLGDVMKESVSIAHTFARKFLSVIGNENDFFEKNVLHLHVPEGAVSKDGPSAGVAMTSSLLSLATNTPLKARVAMTGELSLTGKVLPVGGIKEKVLAAKRSGAKTIILPNGNKRDFDELPGYVKDDVDIHFASEYEEVHKIIFPAKQ